MNVASLILWIHLLPELLLPQATANLSCFCRQVTSQLFLLQGSAEVGLYLSSCGRELYMELPKYESFVESTPLVTNVLLGSTWRAQPNPAYWAETVRRATDA